MEKYKIILDEAKLQDFIDNVLPPLQPHEIYYIALFGRSKYVSDPIIRKEIGDRAQLKRVVSRKEFIISKIKQMETELGSYTTKKGSPIPQESLAIYITINPRDINKANKKAMKLMLDNMDSENPKPPNVIGLDALQVCKGTNYFMDWDFDVVKCNFTVDDLIGQLSECTSLDREDYTILESRGGYHLMVHNQEFPKEKKKWFLEVQKIFSFYSSDNNNELDRLIPIPYCSQGGFMPYIH